MKNPALNPEELVSDFGIKDFIDKNLEGCVAKLSSYSGEEKFQNSIHFVCGIIQAGSDTKSFDNSVKKYSPIVGLRVVSEVAPYVLEYIERKASESGLTILG